MLKEVTVGDIAVPYVTYNAFTRSTGEAGNPAAVVLLSPSAITIEAEHPSGSVDWRWNGSDSFMSDVAAKINLPMTAFLVPQQQAPDNSVDTKGHYLLRWFNPADEMPLCGHATIALSTYIFSERPELEELHLRTKVHGTVIARKAADPLLPESDPMVSIDFPELGGLVHIESTLGSRQKWVQIINDIEAATSGSIFKREDVLEVWQSEHYLLLEFDEGIDIGKIQIDCKKLGGFAPRHVLLTQVALPREQSDEQAWKQVPHLYTRCLGTQPGVQVEDSATGSAHGLIVPHYLANKTSFSRLSSAYPHFDEDRDGPGGRTVRVHQKSARTGDMVVRWEKDDHKVKIFGAGVRTGQGEVTVSGK